MTSVAPATDSYRVPLTGVDAGARSLRSSRVSVHRSTINGMSDLDSNQAHIRLLGMAQALFGDLSRGEATPVGPTRGVCTDEDAARAIEHAAIVLDTVAQGEPVSPNQAVTGIALLMLARDHLVPLPEVNEPDIEGDPVKADLVTMKDHMRAAEMDFHIDD